MTASKQAILSQARRLFDAHGEEALSMRAVAGRAGVTATAIYRHFRGRDHLIEALSESGFALLIEMLGRKRRRPVSPVRDVMANFLDFALTQPRFYELMFLRRRAATRVFPRDFAAHRSPAFDICRARVESELGAADSLEVTLSIWAHAHGLISMFTLGRFGDDVARFRKIYSRSMDRLYKGIGRRR